jgi:hypothetical protein
MQVISDAENAKKPGARQSVTLFTDFLNPARSCTARGIEAEEK